MATSLYHQPVYHLMISKHGDSVTEAGCHPTTIPRAQWHAGAFLLLWGAAQLSGSTWVCGLLAQDLDPT